MKRRHTLGVAAPPPPQAWHLVARVFVATVLVYYVPQWSAWVFLTSELRWEGIMGAKNWTGAEKAVAVSLHDTLLVPATCLVAWKYLVHDGLVGEQNDPRLSRDRVTNDQQRARWTRQGGWLFVVLGCFVGICLGYPNRKLSYLPIANGLWSTCIGIMLLLVSPKTRARLVATIIRAMPIVHQVPVIAHVLRTLVTSRTFDFDETMFRTMFAMQVTTIQAVGPREWVHYITMESFGLVAICELSETVKARDMSLLFVSFFVHVVSVMRTAEIGYWSQAPGAVAALLLVALYFWTDATMQTKGRKTTKQSRENRHAAEELSMWAAPQNSTHCVGRADLRDVEDAAAVDTTGEQWEEKVTGTRDKRVREGTAGSDEMPRAQRRCSGSVWIMCLVSPLVLPGTLVFLEHVVFSWINTGAPPPHPTNRSVLI